jgi:hypothetical protein
LGQEDKALALLEHFKELSIKQYVNPRIFLNAYIGMGDLDKAFESLEQMLKERSPYIMDKVLPALKQEIEGILRDSSENLSSLSRPNFNKLLDEKFTEKGWESQPSVFDERGDPSAKMDFMKERLGIEVGLGHASFIGIDLLKFQIASYSGLDKIDVGVYIVTTKNFQKTMKREFDQNWEGSLSVIICQYLAQGRYAIDLPLESYPKTGLVKKVVF